VSDAEVHVKGLKELQTFLDTLPAKLEANVMRTALRTGATRELLPEVQAILVQQGTVKTGELISGLKVVTRSKGGVITAAVVTGGEHAYLAKWIEFGTKAHNIAAKTGGWLSFGGIFARVVAHPGIKPRAFMRPALDGRATQAVIAVGEYIKTRLSKQGLNTAGITVAGDEP